MTKRTAAARVAKWAIVTLAVAFIGLRLATYVAARQQALTLALPGPDTWVAFTADVQRTNAAGASVAVGKFYQGSDGSSRLETGPSLDDIRLIDIKNIALERNYHYVANRGWIENPMQLIPGMGFPPMRMGPQSLGRVSVMAYEGRAAFQRTFARGGVETVVPDLNFFVVDKHLPTGDRNRFFNIVPGEVDPTLFTLPDGVTATWDPTPSGIIMHGPNDTTVDPKTGAVTYKR